MLHVGFMTMTNDNDKMFYCSGNCDVGHNMVNSISYIVKARLPNRTTAMKYSRAIGAGVWKTHEPLDIRQQ